MPTYTLSGIEVEFPHEAYEVQLNYMTKVIQALQQGQHALLESPTGTGKTLCLLCATLAWRKSLSGAAAAAVGEVQQHQHSSMLVQGLREAWAEHKAAKMAEGGPGSGLPQIVYSSRTHSQLQQVMRELKVCSYKPRSATVASRQHGCLHPVVSTMGSGSNQACRALVSKRACKWYIGVEKFVRQNPEANTEVLDIEDLARIGESRTVCPYYLAREMAATAEIVFLPYNYLLDAKTRAGLGIAWQNAILIFDEAHNVEQVCSDSMSFDLPAGALAGSIEELGIAAEVAANKGDAPVNVFNELGGQDRNASLACVASELQRARAVLCKLEQEIAALAPNPETGLTRPGAFLFELLGRCGINGDTWRVLKSCLEEATSVLTEEAVDAGRRSASAAFPAVLRFECPAPYLSGSRKSAYCLHQVGEALRLAFVGTGAEPEAPPPPPLPSTGGQWPPPRAVLQQMAAPQLPVSHVSYRVHVHMQKGKNGLLTPTLSYWCFSPGLAMQQLTDMQVRSILLTSGTLSPMDSFAHELALPFPVRLENPHVVAKEQVWVGVVPVGPGGHALNSSYQNRENAAYRSDLGQALANFSRIIPDGLLVFFPSYALLSSCIATWKQTPPSGGPSTWERIAKSKQPVIEPRESAAFNAATEDFRAKLLNPAYNGAVFFAVLRGKASEGLDFSDAAGRGVVLTGIPYAMKTDPKVRLKQDILNEARSGPRKRVAGAGGAAAPPAGISGDQWYSQNALRAVNQAVGRVIRHRRDYGAIILCDERFKSPHVLRQLSCWLRGLVTVYGSYGAANASLVQFFKQQGAATRLGLVDGGCKAAVQARPGPFGAAAAAPGGGGGRAAGGAGEVGGGRSLLQQVPAAIDAVGMTELFAPVAAAAAAAAVAAPRHALQLHPLLGLHQQQQQQHLQQQQQQQQQGHLAPPQSTWQPAGASRGTAAGAGQGGGGTGGGAGSSRLMSALGGGAAAAAPPWQASGPTAAAAAAVDNLLGELGPRSASNSAQQGAAVATSSAVAAAAAAATAAPGRQQAGTRPGGSAAVASDVRLYEPRPWERGALAASARPHPPRSSLAAAAAAGAVAGATGNVVGPSHLVAKHAERQRARSVGVSCGAVFGEGQQAAAAAAAFTQQAAAAGAEAGRQGPADDGPSAASGSQQSSGIAAAAAAAPPAPPAAGEAAAAAAEGRAGKAARQAEVVSAFMTRLMETLPKDQFAAIRRALKSYKGPPDIQRLLEFALPLLLPYPALLEAFEVFLPKSLRPTMHTQLQELQAAAAVGGVSRAAGAAAGTVATGGASAQQQRGMAEQQRQQQQQQQMQHPNRRPRKISCLTSLCVGQ